MKVFINKRKPGWSGGECVLFPSKAQRDWSKFEPPILPPFDIKRPEDGDTYFYISDIGEVVESEVFGNIDKEFLMSWDYGNCFNTREQAEYAAGKVKELLLSFRKG